MQGDKIGMELVRQNFEVQNGILACMPKQLNYAFSEYARLQHNPCIIVSQFLF